MKRTLTCLLLLLLLWPIAASAQEGSIRYNRAIKRGSDMPAGIPENMRSMIPMEATADMVLLFNSRQSLMKEAPGEAPKPIGDDRAAGLAARLKLGSTARVDREALLETWIAFDERRVVETRDFMGRVFRIAEARPEFAWKLTGEQNRFLGHAVQKATTLDQGVMVEAWFTPEIPVPGGPGLYGGLPGMILAVSVDSGRVVYSATSVALGATAAAAIKAPEGGSAVTRLEYERTVADKLRELEAQRNARGAGVDRRPPR